jgi:hypothetical protein
MDNIKRKIKALNFLLAIGIVVFVILLFLLIEYIL